MSNPQKDEILELLIFSDGLAEAYVRPERERLSPAGDHWTRPVLLERIAYLRKLARFSDGAAFDTIRAMPGYDLFVMVLLRSRDAVADETHGQTFVVLDGQARLVTGGALVQPSKKCDGEVRGTASEGGINRELRRGDVFHVGAGISHQFLLSGDKSFSSLILRVYESSDRGTV